METRTGYKRCTVCGAEYQLGPNCNRLADAGVMSWKHTADTHKCFQIFCVIKDYADKVASTDDSYDMLSGLLDGVDYSGYDEAAKAIIDEILAAKPKDSIKPPVGDRLKIKNLK